MMEKCGRCGERISPLTGMPFDKRFYEESGRYVGRCSRCEATMHMECFLSAKLSDRRAVFMPRFCPMKLRRIAGYPSAYYLCKECERFVENEIFDQAVRTYERCGDYDDLASLYEAFGYLDLATRVRGGMNGPPSDAAGVELSGPIERLGIEARSVSYQCPHCSASIRIDGRTDPDRLRFCGKCGGALDARDLMAFLSASSR